MLEVITDDLGVIVLNCQKALTCQSKTQKLGLVNLGPNYDIHTFMP